MSCNISIPLQRIIDDVAAALSGRYISTDNPFLNEAVLTDTTLRGDVTADTEARDALCLILKSCGVTAEELEWLARPEAGGQVALSSVVSGDVVTTWQNLKNLVAGYGFSQEYNTRKVYPSYAAMLADKDKLRSGAVVDVANDSTPANNGTYLYDGVSFARSPYNTVDVANIYTDKAIEELLTAGGGILDTHIKTTAKHGGIVRTQAEKNDDETSITDFGCVGGGVTNNDAALAIAFNSGVPLFIPDDDFLYTEVTANAPVRLNGPGRLEYSGLAASGKTSTLTFNSTFRATELNLRMKGADEAIYNIGEFRASGVTIGKLRVLATLPRNQRGGLEFHGDDIEIGAAVSNNVARPLAVTNESGVGADLTKWRKNVHIGPVVIRNYLRGIKFRYIDGLSLGNTHMSGGWEGVTAAPGYNGVLNESVNNASFGFMHLADSAEHAFRFGCPVGSKNWNIEGLYVKNSGGSAFKIAPTPPYLVTDGVVGPIVGYDIGKGSQTGNSEVVRLSSVNNIEIASIAGLVRGTRALVMSDVKKLRIGSVYGENMSARMVEFDMGQDMTSGNCDDIRIGSVSGTVAATARNAISAYYQDGRTINNLRILDVSVSGYSVAAVGMENVSITNSTINVDLVPSAVQVPFEKVPAGVTTRVTAAGKLYAGPAATAYIRGTVTTDSLKMVTSSSTDHSGVYISSMSITSATGSVGGWIGFSRLGSSRRAAGIAVVQTGTANTNNGLALYTQNNSTTSSEAVQLTMLLKHNGTVNLPQLPTVATGLVAGDIWNDAGVLKIV